MYFRLLQPSLRGVQVFARQFKINSSLLKESMQEMKQVGELKNDQPVKFTTSKAGQWKAIYSTSGKSYYERPGIESTVVAISLTAFMVYFCILREENDWDEWLKNVESTVPMKLEEAQLRVEIESAKKRGEDISFRETRLKELVSQRLKKEAL